MKRKTAMAVAGMLVMLTGLAGCGGNDTEEKGSVQIQEEIIVEEPAIEEADASDFDKEELILEEEKKMIDTEVPVQPGTYIAVVSKSVDGEFWDLVKKGMEDAVASVNEMYEFEKAEEITMTFEGPDNELDVEIQVNTIDAVISENPDVLCISVGDMDSCIAQLEAARENGIPVISFDSNVSESDLITAYRATDNLEVGRIAASKLAEKLDETGAIAVFSAPEMTESGRQRVEGFQNELENYDGMEIVDIIYLDQVEDMRSAMQSSIATHPELKAVFCTNADVSEIYLTLEHNLDGRNIYMVGVDATTMQQEAVRNGQQLGVISQNPHLMGFVTIWTALQASVEDEAAVEFAKNELLQPVWIDAENIDDAEYGKYLY